MNFTLHTGESLFIIDVVRIIEFNTGTTTVCAACIQYINLLYTVEILFVFYTSNKQNETKQKIKSVKTRKMKQINVKWNEKKKNRQPPTLINC